MHKIERAIIMAAGKGERLRPLTLETPKPLLPVNGKPMIEGIVEALHSNDIEEIYVVTGYKKEKFDYLKDKYQNISLIENPYYEEYNNLSSLYVAREHIENAIILDGDQIINNINVLNKSFIKSSYCVTPIDNHTNEWVLSVNNNHVEKCSRDGGDHGYQLFSVSKWTEADGKKLKTLLEKEFDNRNTKSYWDDIALNLYPNEFDIGIELIGKEDIIEIDTIDEYKLYNQIV